MKNDNKLFNNFRLLLNNMTLYGLKEFVVFDLSILLYFVIMRYVGKLLIHFNLGYDFSGLIAYIVSLAFAVIIYFVLRKKRLYNINDSKFIKKKCKINSFMSVYAIELMFDIFVISIPIFAFVFFGYNFSNSKESFLDNVSPFVKVIIASIMAPISEELIFRGIGISSLQKYGRTTAILFVSLLFGICHGNFFQTISATISGIALAYIYLEYGLIYSIFLHMMNNFVVSMIDIINPKIILILILLVGYLGLNVFFKKEQSIKKYLLNGSFNRNTFEFGMCNPLSIILILQAFVKMIM